LYVRPALYGKLFIMKDLKKANSNTVTPFIICVLSSCTELFMYGNFINAMEKDYVDLNGLVAFDHKDETNFELLDSLDNEIAVIIKQCTVLTFDAIQSLCKLHSLELNDVLAMEDVQQHADLHLGIRVLFKTEVQNHQESLINLKHFTWSFTQIIFDMCQRVETFQDHFLPDAHMTSMFETDHRFGYLTNSDDEDLRILSVLGSQINELYDDLNYYINQQST